MRPSKAAKIIGCSAQNVRTFIRLGKIKAKKVNTENNQHGYEWDVDPKSVREYAKTSHGNRGVKK